MSSFTFWTRVKSEEISYSEPKTERRTKIVCTIGPKTQSVEMLEALMTAGMNVVRMNFSHGDHKFHLQTIKNVRVAAGKTGKIVGIMLDTKGPEIRTGLIKGGGEVLLSKGQTFKLTTDEKYFKEGTAECVYIDYKNITKVMKKGDRILIDDGLISLVLEDISDNVLTTKVENAGRLGSQKGVNLPGVPVDLPPVSERDIADLQFGVQNGVDFIAASFIRSGEAVREIRKILGPKGANIKIISKIENKQGLDNFDDILRESDGIMVARGDLGVEIPLEKVALAQKMIIAKCNVLGKPVITATQMLETMIYNPRPTRAEATDIANAVLDGTDCVMLSGETAKGNFPVEAVATMARICRSAEEMLDYRALFLQLREAVAASKQKVSMPEVIASSAVKTSEDLNASLIITITETGNTSRQVAKYKPSATVYCITQHKETARQLTISRGLVPITVMSVIGTDAIIKKTINDAKQKGVVSSGDNVVVIFGEREGIAGHTNTLKCIVVN